MKKFLVELIIAIFLGVFVWILLSKVNPDHEYQIINSDTITITKIDTIYKNAYTPTYIPVEHYQLDTVTDTIRIVNDYKEVRVYLDTIRDTSFVVYLRDTITHNQIVSRSYTGNSFQTTKYITNTVIALEKLHVGVGASIMYQNNIISPGISFMAQKSKISGGVVLHQQGLQILGTYYLK